jgi:hypothetical protein
MPAIQPPTPHYRRILLNVMAIEAVFVIGVLLLGRFSGKDPLGGNYGDGAAFIASYVFVYLIIPGLVLALIGRWALLPATLFAAATGVMCIGPYVGLLLPDVPDPIYYGILIAIALAIICAIKLLSQRNA